MEQEARVANTSFTTKEVKELCNGEPSCVDFISGMDGLWRLNINDAIAAGQRVVAVPVEKQKQRLMAAGLDEFAADLAAGIMPTDVAGIGGAVGAARAGAKNDIVTSEGKANAATGKRLGGVLDFQEGSGRQDTSNDAEYIAKTDRSIRRNTCSIWRTCWRGRSTDGRGYGVSRRIRRQWGGAYHAGSS